MSRFSHRWVCSFKRIGSSLKDMFCVKSNACLVSKVTKIQCCTISDAVMSRWLGFLKLSEKQHKYVGDNRSLMFDIRNSMIFSSPLVIKLNSATIFQHLTEDIAFQIWLGNHVSVLAGCALLGQIIKFRRKLLQDTVLHMPAKQEEEFLHAALASQAFKGQIKPPQLSSSHIRTKPSVPEMRFGTGVGTVMQALSLLLCLQK